MKVFMSILLAVLLPISSLGQANTADCSDYYLPNPAGLDRICSRVLECKKVFDGNNVDFTFAMLEECVDPQKYYGKDRALLNSISLVIDGDIDTLEEVYELCCKCSTIDLEECKDDEPSASPSPSLTPTITDAPSTSDAPTRDCTCCDCTHTCTIQPGMFVSCCFLEMQCTFDP